MKTKDGDRKDLITIFTNSLHKMSGEDEDYQFYRRCGITRRIVKGLQYHAG
jgi:hypothetical protein